jgi:hypothetical protein
MKQHLSTTMSLFMALLVVHCMAVLTAAATPLPSYMSSFDAYGSKLAANDLLMVESHPSQSAFFLRLAPYNYTLSCTLPYHSSDAYVYSVAIARQPAANASIRFVFIGSNLTTKKPFIGLLTYTGVKGSAYVASTVITKKTVFPCDGWQASNYRIHTGAELLTTNSTAYEQEDPFVLVVQ